VFITLTSFNVIPFYNLYEILSHCRIGFAIIKLGLIIKIGLISLINKFYITAGSQNSL